MLLNRIEVMERPGVGYMRVIISSTLDNSFSVMVRAPAHYGYDYDTRCGTYEHAMAYAVELCRQHTEGKLK